jgi:hypothetical protein
MPPPAPIVSLVVAYARERLPLRRYVPLSLLIAVAALTGDVNTGPGRLACGAGMALGLLFQFRLWDDLADLPRDRVEHPGRVLSGAPAPAIERMRAVLRLCTVFNAVVIGALAPFPGHVAVFLAVSGFFLLWYGFARGALPSAASSSLVVLVKYPVFVYHVGGAPAGIDGAWHRALAAALVYLSFCVYEVLHDPRVRGERFALPLLGAEMLSMIAVSSLMGVAVARRSAAFGLGHAAVGISCAFGLSLLFLRCRLRGALTSSSQGVFLLCFLQIVSFTAGIRA